MLINQYDAGMISFRKIYLRLKGMCLSSLEQKFPSVSVITDFLKDKIIKYRNLQIDGRRGKEMI